jgi:hypothetical protein
MMVQTKQASVLPVVPDAIPRELKERNQWVVWENVPKPDGKIGKVPIDPNTGRRANALDPKNHLTCEKALSAVEGGIADGVGFVLMGEPVGHDLDGSPLYLVGLDLDKVQTNPERARALLEPLRGAYVETSPSGTGLRLFCTSRYKPRSGQGVGGELYAEKRFLTVTGQNAHGSIRDCTEGVKAVERMLLGDKEPARKLGSSSTRARIHQSVDDTPRQRAGIAEMLTYISADCDYERYRDVVWAILSLGWHDIEELACQWCMTAPDRFDEGSFLGLVNSHDLERTPTLGTLIYFAREGGWRG